MKTTLGTCSLCGGAVTMPSVWHATVPPPLTCERCGAEKAAAGPVIDMGPRPSLGARPVQVDGVTVPLGEIWNAYRQSRGWRL